MHLAAALGTPVAALFGPTAPWRTGPFGEGHQVVRLGLSCSPCFKRQCPDPRCLTDLSPEMVEAACEKILSVRPLVDNMREVEEIVPASLRLKRYNAVEN